MNDFVYSQHVGSLFVVVYYVSHGRVCTCSLVIDYTLSKKVAKTENRKSNVIVFFFFAHI